MASEQLTAIAIMGRPDRIWAASAAAPTAQSDVQRFVIMADETLSTDPFLILSDDQFSRVGFDWHPHRGFEAVTYVIAGELEHKDSTGAHEMLQAGDVQWTAMGWKVFHAELAYERRHVHTLQLWINTPEELRHQPARYQNVRAADVPIIAVEGVQVRVYSGQAHGVTGPVAPVCPLQMIDGRVGAGSIYAHQFPTEYAGFVYVTKGALCVGADEATVTAGQVAWFDAGAEGGVREVALHATEDAAFVAYAARPIGEPVAMGGPFVGRTRADIRQAFLDYQRGEFGEAPTW